MNNENYTHILAQARFVADNLASEEYHNALELVKQVQQAKHEVAYFCKSHDRRLLVFGFHRRRYKVLFRVDRRRRVSVPKALRWKFYTNENVWTGTYSRA